MRGGRFGSWVRDGQDQAYPCRRAPAACPGFFSLPVNVGPASYHSGLGALRRSDGALLESWAATRDAAFILERRPTRTSGGTTVAGGTGPLDDTPGSGGRTDGTAAALPE